MAVTQAYSFADLFAFTRATSGWSFDAAGALAETAAGAVRADYDPATLAWRGWLIEGAATNEVNGGTEGGLVGTPGVAPTGWGWPGASSGMTREVVAIGAEDGVPYVDVRWYGTPVSTFTRDMNFVNAGVVPAVSGETWISSFFARLVAGSTANVTVSNIIFGRTSGGAIAETSNVGITGSLAVASLRLFQSTFSRAMNNATTAFVNPALRLSFTSGLAADITLRVGAPQLWKSSVAFSPSFPPVGTPGASARAADDLTMSTISRWFNEAAGTFVIDFTPGQAAAPADRDILMIDDGSSANRLRLRMLPADTTVRLGVTNAGVGSAALNAASGAARVRHTARFSYGPAGHFLSVNGAAPVSHTAAVPGGLTRVLVGNSGGANYLNGWIGPRLDYFPTQYTDTVAADGFTIRTR